MTNSTESVALFAGRLILAAGVRSEAGVDRILDAFLGLGGSTRRLIYELAVVGADAFRDRWGDDWPSRVEFALTDIEATVSAFLADAAERAEEDSDGSNR